MLIDHQVHLLMYTIAPGDFSVFALKIVFRSTNSSRVPQCKDLRAIAVKK